MQSITETPLDNLAGYLHKITELCSKLKDLPEELKTCVERASSLVSELSPSPKKNKMGKCAQAVSKKKMDGVEKPEDIQVYKMLLQLTGARNILYLPKCSISTALSLGDLIPEYGKLFVRGPETPGEDAYEDSHRNERIHVKIGSTSEILKDMLAAGEQFDMVFIDAAEQNHTNDYNLMMSSNMLRRNGVICLQNSSANEERTATDIRDETGAAARKMTDAISAAPGVEKVVFPVGCAITIVKRKPFSSIVGVEKGILQDDVFWGQNKRGILDRLRLDGKVAYVTGGGQGIGRAFAHALGEAGAKVVIIDIALEKAEAVAYELQLKGIKSVAMAADVSKEGDVKQVVDTVVANWGRIDIACNNAGINMISPSEDTTLEEWDKTFNVNLRGLFVCCQEAGRVMLRQGYGKIINTASMASLIVPHPQKQLAYNTSKAGVVKLTQTLGTEWIDRGVRVNCISPGIVDTPLIHTDALRPLVQRWLSDIPAGRLAQVTDLQAAVVYLASEASDYMTGHNLVIDGGQSLW
ncbi:uncharacterized protein RCH25_006759 [Pelodytes ibericus]